MKTAHQTDQFQIRSHTKKLRSCR